MASAIEKVPTVTTLLMEFGKTCRRMMWNRDPPMDVAACEYSRSRIASASDRMMRAFPHHPVNPMSRIRNVVEFPKMTMSAIRRNRYGIERNVSMMRIRTASTAPPKKPEIIP